MQRYRVSIWTTVDIEAGNEFIANEIAREMLVNQEIRNRDFFTTAELIECEHELNYDDVQSEPHKGHEYYYCGKCHEAFVYDANNDKIIKQKEGK